MATVKLAYVDRFRDAGGAWRYYFRRRRGAKRIPLPGRPGEPEFMREYALACANSDDIKPMRTVGPLAGTFDALAAAYYGSTKFLELSPSTKATYRGIIERFSATKGKSGIPYGQNLVVGLKRKHVNQIIAAKLKLSGPSAARNLLKVLSVMFTFAVKNDWVTENPTIGVDAPKVKTDGFVTWSEQDIAKFEDHHASGTRARLALRLLLYTAQRRGDAVRMGHQHLGRDSKGSPTIRVRQNKTTTRLVIPMHPKLLAEIQASGTANNLTFILTQWGKPYSAAGFGNWFREKCDEAGLPELSAHGLRKAAARRLAEAGCTPHQIQAITGHKSLAEVVRYTIAANQERMAREAIDRIEEQ